MGKRGIRQAAAGAAGPIADRMDGGAFHGLWQLATLLGACEIVT